MKMTTVDGSSNVEAIGYDEASKELHVTFRGGTTYSHDDVPHSLFLEFSESLSKGSFYAKEIRNKFKAAKLT